MTSPDTGTLRLRTLCRHQWRAMLWTALAYFLVGRLSLLLAIPPGYASPIWPAAGIGFAAALIRGYGVLPGVWLGSFLVNAWPASSTTDPNAALLTLTVAGTVGLGAMLQAGLGAFLVQRYVGYPTLLGRERDAAVFLLLGGGVAAVASPSVGVGVLWLCGAIHDQDVAYSWLVWWVGDAIGCFTFGPIVLMVCGEPRRAWRGLRLRVGLPLGTALWVAVAAYLLASSMEERTLRQQFEARAREVSAAVERLIGRTADDARDLGALFDASNEVDRDEFARFSRRLLLHTPGIQVLEWAPRLAHADLARFTAAQGADLPGFAVWERDPDGQRRAPAQRDEYLPVCYLEPLRGNQAAAGFDLASEPRRRAAIHAARDSGQPRLTATVSLVQGSGARSGALMVFPVYGKGAPPQTVAERRFRFAGVVLAVVFLDDWLGSVVRELDAGRLQVRFRDLDAGTAPILANASSEPHVFSITHPIDAGGRRWTFEIGATRRYVADLRPLQAWTLLVGAMLFCGLFGLVLLGAAGRTAAVERSVEERTSELRQTSGLLAQRIDELRAADNLLRKSQEELEHAQERARLGSWELDPATNTGSWSKGMFRLLERDPALGVPPLDEFLSRYVHADDQATLLDVHSWVVQNEAAAETTFRVTPAVTRATHLSAGIACEREPESGRLRMVGTLQDVSDRKAAEDVLRRGLREKEVMVQEIHHRVKNNLQIVVSILGMQARRVDDQQLRQVLRDCQDRIHAMAGIHETLYRASDLTNIDLRTHVTDLCRRLVSAHGLVADRVALQIDAPPVSIDLEQAVPMSLLLNELVANACKHAFKDERGGVLRVAIGATDGRVTSLEVGDDGVGLPPDFDFAACRSLGMHLVTALARQLGWTLAIDGTAGTRIRVSLDDGTDDKFSANDADSTQAAHR